MRALADLWGLSEAAGRVFWGALMRAQGAKASELRQLLIFHEHLGPTLGGPTDVRGRHVLHNVCAPKVVLAVIEDLVDEALLSRAMATILEEALLKVVDARGSWTIGR
jgi:hypothetical protein